MSDTIIDGFEIQKRIGRAHKNFIKSFYATIEKATADRYLQLYTTCTRLSYIFKIFIEERVVDVIEENNIGNTSYKSFDLRKQGCVNSIHVFTDGRDIIMRHDEFNNLRSESENFKSVAFGANSFTKEQWSEFADDLLVLIHHVIYQSKEATELKLFGSL